MTLLPKLTHCFQAFSRSWRRVAMITTPLILLPLVFQDGELAKPLRCLYVTLIMAIFWALEILPVAVTGLFPIVLLPVLGLRSPDNASSPYFREENVLFLCCLMIAITVECSNVHRRIALRILKSVGTRFSVLVLAFMLVTAVFGILINNSAATAMMIPIGDAVLEQVYPEDVLPDEITDGQVKRQGVQVAVIDVGDNQVISDQATNVKSVVASNKKCLYLCLAYAATIGSCASLTSNGPNLVLKREVEKYKAPVEYASWLVICVPGVIALVVATWFIMKLLYIRKVPGSDEGVEANAAKKAISMKYDELGPVSFHETITLLLLLGLVFLWMFRNPSFVKGWAEYFCAPVAIEMTQTTMSDFSIDSNSTSNDSDWTTIADTTMLDDNTTELYPSSTMSSLSLNHTLSAFDEAQRILQEACNQYKPKDSTAAMAILLLMFIIPANPLKGNSKTLVTWDLVQKKLSWGLLFMRGGGFSLADAFESSQLSKKVSDILTDLGTLPWPVMFVIFILVASLLTEFLSNTATTLILLPIAKNFSITNKKNPLILMMSIAITCSLAFVLPVGTPPNSLVYAHRNFRTSEMVIPGICVKLVCIPLMLLVALSIAWFWYGLGNNNDAWQIAMKTEMGIL